MATPGKLTKKEMKKQIPAKTSFSSPFSQQWSSLPQEDMHFILQTLKKKLVSIGLEKKEVRVFRPWRKKKDKKPCAASESLPVQSQDSQVPEAGLRNGWTDGAARRQLAIGINEVTKALERNQLQLVLVCKSVRPKHMTTHLIPLSATRHVPACQVPRLSESVSEPLGLKSVLALGFRNCTSKEDGIFTDTVDAIIPRVPTLDVAWLQGTEAHLSARGLDQLEEDVGEKRGQKRKCEDEPEKVAESSGCTLQPLKVKKIIANPSKKRTPRKKKA
ncbi:ribonuclease P protein subunit p38 [Myripristis murdjan]|uniref:Ribonuclease P/MRP 38 subunit n=1 Tax=Myripristis murdjan TaxID=586833 RepID=A0A667XLP9_9TELE|nr:ribonuclease P protein subunit p38 [Myripristis murdjan]